MPMKRGYKKRRPRRFTRRRAYRRRTRVPRIIGPKTHTYAKLAYGRITNVNLSAGSLLTETFCINGMFDPETALGGNQPLFFDQYMAMYKNYRVYGCKVMIKLSAGSSTNNCFHICSVITPSTVATPPYGSIQTAYQARGSVYRNIVPTAGAVTMSKYYPIHYVFGVPKGELRYDDNLSGTASTNPPISCYVHLYNSNRDGTAVFPITYEVKLIYYAKFYNLTEPAAS